MESDDDLFCDNEDIDENKSDEEDWKDTNWDQTVHPSFIKAENTIGSLSHLSKSETTYNEGSVINMCTSTISNSKIGGKPELLMTRMELNDHKAGMEGLDKAKINQIIYDASKGSRYFENEKKKEEQVRERILDQKRRMANITPNQIQQGLQEADALLQDLERSFDLSRMIVHVDMDAFYAAVEMRDDPSLRNKPMAVGGTGMLSTSNYRARKYGVRAAMPGFIGLKLCPDLIIVKSNSDKYTAVSKDIRSVMADYDPNYCPMSLDEAYLDFTEHLIEREDFSEKERSFLVKDCALNDKTLCICDLNTHLRSSVIFGESEINLEIMSASEKSITASSNPKITDDTLLFNSTEDDEELLTQGSSVFSDSSQVEKQMSLICPHCNKLYPPYTVNIFGKDVEEAVNEMRCRIEQKTRLTASAGIASNMMLAKVCSDKNKPNGQYRILPTREAIQSFIDNLPIRKISGIGKVTEQMLNALNIVTCTDLYNHRALLFHLYSDISFNYFMRICLGIGSIAVERDTEKKSMSTERTFHDLSNAADLYQKCSELSESLVADLKEESLKGKTVTLKIKTSTFEVKTRAQTLRNYTWDQEMIYSTCKELLRIEMQKAQPNPLVLRLMGVRMSNLLHQSLCPKSKQETISGFMKKMGSKQSENTANSPSKEFLITSENSNSCDESDQIDSNNVTVSRSIDLTLQTETTNTFSAKLMKSQSLEMSKKEKSVCHRDLFSSADIYVCPVCDKEVHCGSALAMSLHVDKCLIVGEHTDNCDTVTPELPNIPPSTGIDDETVEFPQCDLSVRTDSSCCQADTRTYTCPICNLEKVCSSLDQFNFHVDACLSQGTIKEILQEQKVPSSQKLSSDMHNSGTSKKRRLNISDKKSEQTSKKKKNDSVKTKPIDSFFKS